MSKKSKSEDRAYPFDVGAAPSSFGEGNDYWDRYYELAQKQDSKDRRIMIVELDTLLIFGALISAITTAFVTISLPMLSPSPSDETNNYLRLMLLRNQSTPLSPEDLSPPPFRVSPASVRINCFFIASLSFSVLSTFGAMLGKQWLAYVERIRHNGSVRYRALQLQKRLSSADRWGLSNTFQILSGLLQAALVLFLAGLTDLLWSTHRSPALLSLSLIVAGVVVYSCTLSVVWLDPYSPFQTQFLNHHRFRFLCRVVVEISLDIVRTSTTFGVALTLIPFGTFMAAMARLTSTVADATKRKWDVGSFSSWVHLQRIHTRIRYHSRQREAIERNKPHPPITTNEAEADAHSVQWLLDNTADDETTLLAIQNVMTLRDLRAVTSLSRSLGSTNGWIVEQLKKRLKRASGNTAVLISNHTFSDATACKILIKEFAHISIGTIPTSDFWTSDGKDMAVEINALEPSETPSDMDDVTLFKSITFSTEWRQPEVGDYLPIIRRVDTGCLRAFLSMLSSPFGDCPSVLRHGRERWIIEWYGQRRQLADAAALSLLQRAGDNGVTLNTVFWALNDILNEDHRMFNEDGLWSRASQPKWLQARWKAYISVEDLIHNFIVALAAYPEQITHARDAIANGRPSVTFNETYVELLQKIRLFFANPKAAKTHAKDLRGEWPKLLRTMEAIIILPRDQPDTKAEGCGLVRREVVLTMDALWPAVCATYGAEDDTSTAPNRPKAEALMRATELASAEDPAYLAALVTTMHVASSRDDAENLELLAAQASAITLLVSALHTYSKELRFATISILSKYSATWFSQPDAPITQQLRNADLPHALVTSIRLHCDWSSMSADVLSLLGPMCQWAEWRSAILKAVCTNIQNVQNIMNAPNDLDSDYARSNRSFAELGCLTETSVDMWLQAYHASASDPPAADSTYKILGVVERYLQRGQQTVIMLRSFKKYLELMKPTSSPETRRIVGLLDKIREIELGR